MSKAKEIMHRGAECVAASDTLETAARMMRDGHVGSLPICGPDNRLQGIITDRDIVVRCLARYTRASPKFSGNRPVPAGRAPAEVIRA